MTTTYTAFTDHKQIARGPLAELVPILQKHYRPGMVFLVFDDHSGRTIDLDFHGTKEEVARRMRIFVPAETAPSSGPGRPRLGVVPREVSLLPRHWEWLAQQPGGSSAALRRLVEDAQKSRASQVRIAQDATYRFLSVAAGDLPGYEEALRALYAKKESSFHELTAAWPKDLRAYARKMAGPVFEG